MSLPQADTGKVNRGSMNPTRSTSDNEPMAADHYKDPALADDAVLPSRRPASVRPENRRVQIAAAQARITLDRLIGDSTPEWIIALSREVPE